MLDKPALEIMQPAWSKIVPANVDALMTLRAGGVSSGPFGDKTGVGGFNVGQYVGDVPFCVNMNRNLAAQLVPSDPKWLKQTHGTEVVDAETAAAEVEADASTSLTPGVVCVVQTADCLPLLLAEKNGRAVAAVHASWKSLAAGIIQKTVARLRERLGDESAQFVVWMGPRIGDDDFEVGADVLDAMKVMLPQAQVAFKAKEDGKFLASLSTLALQALAQVGVDAADVVDAKRSTYANDELFYSYRRDGVTGRHATMIWMKE